MNTPENKTAGKSNLHYGIMAYICFLLLALFWSVDGSIALILFAGGSFCLYLAAKKSQHGAFRENGDSSKDSLQNFNHTFKESNTGYEPQKPNAPTVKKRGVILAVACSVAVFTGMVLLTLLSSNDDETYFYQRGEVFYDQGQYDSAALYFKKALVENSQSVKSMIGLGNALMMNEKNDSALFLYNNALAADLKMKMRFIKRHWFFTTGNNMMNRSIPLKCF